MLHNPNPVLNREERELLDSRPEECLRRAVRRSALPLDQITAGLPAPVRAAVRSIATGERPPRARARGKPDPGGPQARPGRAADSANYGLGQVYPHLEALIAAGVITPEEAMEAVRQVDSVLGRYATGTRYAAP